MTKKILALILAISMIFTLFPVAVFASEEGNNLEMRTPVFAKSENESVSDGNEYAKWIDNPDGTKSYYINDTAVTGLQTIDESVYYFDETGIMQTGVQKIGETLYFFYSDGKAVTATNEWFKVNGYYKYATGNGTIASGIKMIDSKYYFFNTTTGSRKSKGFFEYEGNSYYCLGAGKLACGWTAVGKNAYYFHKDSCTMAKDETIGYLYVPKSGHLGQSYARGIQVLNKNGWTLRKAFEYSRKLKYANRWMRRSSSESYANYGFTKGYGNCYVMAGTFYVQAKLLGYNVRQIEGKVSLPHSWTQIKHGSTWYVYDPNFTNETGRNGYKIQYGKSGTWRYNSYHVFQTKNKITI